MTTTKNSLTTVSNNNTQLPSAFIELCHQNNVDPLIYSINNNTYNTNNKNENNNNYDGETTNNQLPRFIRFNPRNFISKTQLEFQIGSDIKHVSWLPSKEEFYQLPAQVKLKQTDAYEKGQIYGMDVSSALPVLLLNAHYTHNVLDLCCSPGGKLCYIADYLWKQTPIELRDAPIFTVSGIDLSVDRLYATRSIVNKYRVPNIRLILADATEFTVGTSNNQNYDNRQQNSSLPESNKAASVSGGVIRQGKGKQLKKLISCASQSKHNPTSSISNQNQHHSSFTDKRSNNTWLQREGILFYQSYGMYHINNKLHLKHNGLVSFPSKKVPSTLLNSIFSDHHESHSKPEMIAIEQYDRVLVDAECTHDGSVRHVQKMLRGPNPEESIQNCIIDENRRRYVSQLQRRLLWNGFRQLRTNGILVYSTCSMCREQDEDVVQWLLEKEKDNASLIDAMKRLKEISNPTNEIYNDKIDDNDNCSDHDNYPWRRGFIPETIRMNPSVSGTSGMFMAVIKKIES